MDIKVSRPLIWPLVKIFFPAAKWGEVIVTWGDSIYSKYPVSQDLIAHESVHIMQQKMSKLYGLIWWARYIVSSSFRLSQEVICKFLGRGPRVRARIVLAQAISSPVYKNMISYEKAYNLFK
jgi:hypothetical protein